MYSDVNRIVRKLSELVPLSELDENRFSQTVRNVETLRRKYIQKSPTTSARYSHDLSAYWNRIAKA